MSLQYSVGAEPLPFETGSKLRTETVFELAGLVSRHKNLKFMFFLSAQHQNQAFCTLARELPNVYLSGYWWHNFFPSIMRRTMAERIDMLSPNKNIGFFTDAYCTDWCYGKSVIIKRQLARVLAEKVCEGQFDIETALDYVQKSVFDTPGRLLVQSK